MTPEPISAAIVDAGLCLSERNMLAYLSARFTEPESTPLDVT